jgi:hypothetical protein
MMYAKYCPSCKSKNITLYAGGITGAYECGKCGYVGTLILEMPLIPKVVKGKRIVAKTKSHSKTKK